MAVELTSEEMVETIKQRKGARSMRELAEETGLTQQHISDIIHGRKQVSARVARAFGFKRLMKFRKGPGSSKG